MRSKRRHSFPGPAIATARGQLVAIENAGDWDALIGEARKRRVSRLLRVPETFMLREPPPHMVRSLIILGLAIGGAT